MRIIGLMGILCFVLNCSQAQIDSLGVVKKQTIASITAIETRLETFESADSFNQLSATCVRLKYFVKKEKDLDRVRRIRSFCNRVLEELDIPESHIDKILSAQYINRDLNLKLQPRETSLNWNSSFFFDEEKNIKVTAKINGKTVSGGSYRMFWFTLHGAHLFDDIKQLRSEGRSPDYNNPYQLKILVPGIITFWMKDERTGKLFKPNTDFLPLDVADSTAAMEFSELKSN